MIARLEVTRGATTEYPLAERVRGGWQNGVTFYPDAEVVKVTPLAVVPAPDAPADIEQEARAEAEKHLTRNYGERWREWPDDQIEAAMSDYTVGYIAGASRPASPVTREAVAPGDLDSLPIGSVVIAGRTVFQKVGGPVPAAPWRAVGATAPYDSAEVAECGPLAAFTITDKEAE